MALRCKGQPVSRRHVRITASFTRIWLLLAAVAPGTCLAQSILPQVGCAEWHRASALTLDGTVQEGGLNGRFTLLLDTHGGRNAVSRDFGVFSESSGFDGKVGWSRDRSGGSHDLNAEAALAISTSESWILRRGWCDVHDVVIEPMPDESDAGAAVSVWRITPKDGIPTILRFDRRSGLLRQAEYRMWGNRLIRHYDNWRDVGRGIMVALSERDEDPEDEETETITVSSARLGKRHFPPSTFVRPAQPKDYTILGGAQSTTVPYEDDGGARIYVSVFINGQGPYAFEIDTGGHLIIGTELAKALELEPVGQFTNTGAGTAVTLTGAVANQEIRIGNAVIRRQVAKVRPFPNDRITGRSPRMGLLGLELFERFAVRIDRAKKEVVLTPLERFTGGSGTALPIRFIEDAPLTRGAYNGIDGDFEIDSGNSGPTIIEGYWAHAHGLDATLSKGLPWTAGTGASGYREWLSRGNLELGPIKLPHQIVSYVGQPARGAESTQLQAGLAGEWALRCFDTTYDYPPRAHRARSVDVTSLVGASMSANTGNCVEALGIADDDFAVGALAVQPPVQVRHRLRLDSRNRGREVSGIRSLGLADINNEACYGDDARIDAIGRDIPVEDAHVVEKRAGSDTEWGRHDERALS